MSITRCRAMSGPMIAAGVATLIALAAGSMDARAQNFQQEVGGRSTLKLRDVPSVKQALDAVKLTGSLGNLEMASVTTTPSTISGFVNFIAMRWNFLVFKSGTSTYFALEPVNAQGQPRTPKLSDFLSVPGIQLTDMLTFDRVAMVVAVRKVTLDEKDLPAPAKAMFGPYFRNKLANVDLGQGITYFGMADLGKLKPLRDAITFIGGQSTALLFKAQLGADVLGSLVKGEKPSISARFEALLPSFKPSIGKKIQLPVEFTFGLVAELAPPDVKFGYVGEAEVPFVYPDIARKKVATARTTMDLQVGMGLEGGKPTFSVSGTMFKGEQGAFKQAFGLPFIDLQDYTMEFEQSADAISVGIGAGGRFYDKAIETFASVQVRASTSGIPIPKQIKFMVTPTSPSQTAYLALTDLTNAFADLTSAVTGARIPKPRLPDNFVQIKGAKAGEGPFIDVTLDIGLDAGLEMAGGLTVFGTELGKVETAVIRPTHGIEIKARSGVNLPVDILELPQADIDIAITKDNITDPHVRIRTQTVQVLGSGGAFELSIDKARQVAVVEGATPFNLFNASLVLDSSTQNLRRPNFDVTGIIEGNFFNRLADGLQAATADLVKGTEAVVAGINGEVHKFSDRLRQAKIDKSRAVNDLEAARKSAYAAFERAKAEVNRLDAKYRKEKDKCGPEPWKWDHCVAAGTLWTALKAARGVLSLAQKAVDEFLKGTGKVLSAVVDGLNKTINALGGAIDKATGALGSAFVKFTKVLDLGAKLAGKALESVASIFDIEKLWMKGKLAILQGQQKGSLGVEYTMLGKNYLQDVAWDFRVPVEQIVEIFSPGSKPSKGGRVTAVTVAPGYTFEPASTDVARNTVSYLMNNAVLKAVSVPFDPDMCVTNPYSLDQQLAEINGEAARLGRMIRNAEVYDRVQAMEGSAAFRALVANPPAGSSTLRWQGGRNGSVPGGAVAGGREPGRTLYVCRASYKGGVHPGKVVGRNCNIGYGGKEQTIGAYEVLTGSGASWVAGRNGSVPGGALAGGREPGRTLYICRASYKGGVHPGKVVGRNCNIGYGGKEHTISSYEVLVQSGAVSAAQVPFRIALANAYKQGKASNARPESAARYTEQGKILQAIDGSLKRLPPGDPARREVEANLRKPSSDPGAVNVKFLTDRRNEALALVRQMVALKKDPASPCGKAIQQAKVNPASTNAAEAARTVPRGMAALVTGKTKFATSSFARAAVMASEKLKDAQQKEAVQRAAQIRRVRLVAFANRVKVHEAMAQKGAAAAARARTARQAIVPAALAVNAQAARQIATAAQASAAHAARVQKTVKAPSMRPRVAKDRPAARSTARSVARGAARTGPLGLTPQQRSALGAAYAAQAQRLTQGATALRQSEAARDRTRAAIIARRQALMTRRLATVAGLTAPQKASLAKAFAESRAAARAELIKQAPVGRVSSVPGTPSASQQANARKEEAADRIDTVQITADIIESMKKNLK